jgi:hypothetical protein
MNNFSDNKGQIHVQGPFTTICTLLISSQQRLHGNVKIELM